MLNVKQKGVSTELQCLAEFAKLGIMISIPYGDYGRYDFIADINNKLYRIQCKTSSLQTEGVYTFSCRSTTGNTAKAHARSYDNTQIDYFATMIDNNCYLIPVDETGGTSKTLRFLAPKNGQKEGISFAKDYELQIQLNKLLEKENIG